MGKRLICFLCACFMCCASVSYTYAEEVQPASENASIEQVYLNMPEVTVYGYGLGQAGSLPEAYLGDEKLNWVSTTPFTQTGEGVKYYIMLDISDSMPRSYFTAVKDAIVSFYQKSPQNDSVTLMTFGESVKVLTESEKQPEKIKELLDPVKNKDRKTLLFEAVTQASDMAGQVTPEAFNRKVMIVISDGEDIAVGKKMSQEALSALKEKGIPVYAMCIKDTARANINSFGEFARMSGGEIKVFQTREAESTLQAIHDYISSANVMHFQANSNKVTNQYEQFALQMPEGRLPLNREVFSYRWIPDTTAPELLSAEQLEGRQIKLKFSEAVIGDDIASNYVLKGREKMIPIGGVAYVTGEDGAVIITAAEPLEAGEYAVSCVNITDNSQEKNGVANTLTLHLDSGEGSMSIWIIVIFALLIAALIIFAIVAYQKIKKNRGVVFVDGKPVMASSVDVKQHVAITPAPRKSFDLYVTVAGKNPKKMEMSIDKSMIVGRSSICELYFDDNQMSRQHFVLEWDGNDMYITDLETTNGTSVNGVRIQGRRKLICGDQISAGAEELLIKW